MKNSTYSTLASGRCYLGRNTWYFCPYYTWKERKKQIGNKRKAKGNRGRGFYALYV